MKVDKKIRPLKPKLRDVAATFMFASALPIEAALKIAKVKMLQQTKGSKSAECAELLEEYRKFYTKGRTTKGYRRIKDLEKNLGITRPHGGNRRILKGLGNYLDKVDDHKTQMNKKNRWVHLNIEYYFDTYKPSYNDETRAIIRQFLSDPLARDYFLLEFNSDWSSYPIVRLDELIETVIQTAIWFYEMVGYTLYFWTPLRGFLHVEEKTGFTDCHATGHPCEKCGRGYHLHYLREERSNEIKESMKTINTNRYDDAVVRAAGNIVQLAFHYKTISDNFISYNPHSPYRYYFVFGRLLSTKGLIPSYQFNSAMSMADDLKPRSSRPVQTICPKCEVEPGVYGKERVSTHYRDFCDGCMEFASDDELAFDPEIQEELDRLYLNQGNKKLIANSRLLFKKAFLNDKLIDEVRIGNAESVRTLLKQGADANAIDSIEKIDCLAIARKNGHKDVLKLLEKRKEKRN